MTGPVDPKERLIADITAELDTNPWDVAHAMEGNPIDPKDRLIADITAEVDKAEAETEAETEEE